MRTKITYLFIGILIGIFLVAAITVLGQNDQRLTQERGHKVENDLLLTDFDPYTCMVTPDNTPEKAKFPAIDAHIHIGTMNRGQSPEELIKIMDASGVQTLINVSGLDPEGIKTFNEITKPYPGRFVTYTTVNWKNLEEPDFLETTFKQLEEAKRLGAKGVGEFKEAGFGFGGHPGVYTNHKTVEAIWNKCGELGLPVSLHVGDPVSFYRPLDKFNERWDELIAVPRFLMYGKDVPSHDEYQELRNQALANCPNTIFICCHQGNYPENLAKVAEVFDKYPNFYVDMSERLGELGRQPYTARKHFIKYQDRIVFGSDRRASEWTFRTHWRFFETQDEYFKYRAGSIGMQGRWGCYGIYLPDEVLEKVYRKNIIKLLNL